MDLKDVAVLLALPLQHALLFISAFAETHFQHQIFLICVYSNLHMYYAFVVEKYSHHVWLFSDMTSNLISQSRVLRGGEDNENYPEHRPD